MMSLKPKPADELCDSAGPSARDKGLEMFWVKSILFTVAIVCILTFGLPCFLPTDYLVAKDGGWSELRNLLITVCFAVFGWVVAHEFASRRDLANKKREIVLDYLMAAYETLAVDVSHRDMVEKNKMQMERLIAKVQLYGSPRQAELIVELAKNIKSQSECDLNPLIKSLRSDLRKSLELPEIKGDVYWLRY